MKYKDMETYAGIYPLEARHLSAREEEGNCPQFFADLRKRIESGRELTKRQQQALTNAARLGVGAKGGEAPLPKKGSTVSTRICIMALEQKTDRRGNLVNMYRFGPTEEGWVGRLETPSRALEDRIEEHGFRFPEEESIRVEVDPPYPIDIQAEVQWVPKDGNYVILGGACAFTVPGEDPSEMPEPRAKRPGMRGQASKHKNRVKDEDWKKALGLQ